MDGRTKSPVPCVLQDFVPFRAAAQKAVRRQTEKRQKTDRRYDREEGGHKYSEKWRDLNSKRCIWREERLESRQRKIG